MATHTCSKPPGVVASLQGWTNQAVLPPRGDRWPISRWCNNRSWFGLAVGDKKVS